jgi:hypothetical protein
MEQSVDPMACPDCHALTDDLATHERWHSRLVHDIAVAVDKENKRREAAASRP